MSWFKLDDQAAFDAKVVAAGNEAFGAWSRGGCWSSGKLTEGFIPKDVALAIAPARVWDRLVSARAGHDHGLVEARPDGWQIHDYLDWNPTAESVRAKRSATKARVNRFRNAVTKAAPQNEGTDRPDELKQAIAVIGNVVTNGVGNTSPVPVPVPVPRSDPPVCPPLEDRPSNPFEPPIDPRPKPAKGRRAKAETSQPDSWVPNEGHAALAAELGVVVAVELPRFLDHHAAKGSRFRDWDAAFRTWLRNAPGFAVRGPAHRGSSLQEPAPPGQPTWQIGGEF